MPKPVKLSDARAKARRTLLRGSCKSTARMYQLNPGLVSAIRRGKRQASRRVLNVLGIIYYEEAAAPVCREHGIAHGIQHRHKPTFEENARAYADWLTSNAAELARRVVWAEWQTVPKGKQ